MGLFDTITGLVKNVSGLFGAATAGLGQFGQFSAASGLNLLPSPIARPAGVFPISNPIAVGPVPRVAMATTQMGVGSIALQTARAVGSLMTRATAPILIKIAETLGRRSMTLRQAVKIIRRTGTFLGPAAAAAAVGITLSEMAELIMADASRPRRRMNPANISALRRSMRRIQSFHRLCQKADTLRGRSRRSSRRVTPGHPGTTIVQAR